MRFADRLKISSIISLSLLAFMSVLLLWSSRELGTTRDNHILADKIQAMVFQRATLRDEYFLNGTERARIQWVTLSGRAGEVISEGGRRFTETEDRRVLERVQADFHESVIVSRRLVQHLRIAAARKNAHHDEFASRLYSQIMLKDSALEQGVAALQNLARDRFDQANDTGMRLTIMLVFVMVAGTMANSSLINSLLRRRLVMLNKSAAIIASGDLDHRIDCEGGDELAEFGRVLNSVAGRVQDYTGQLKKSHELLNDLSSQVPGILFQASLSASGEFSTPYVSNGFSDLYEAAPGEVVPAPATIFDSCNPDGRGLFATFLRSAQTLQPWECEYEIRVPDGSGKWLHGHARPVRLDDGGTLWHGFISDVTERKLIEEALSESEKRFRLQLLELANIYNHTPVGLFAVDRELRFLRLNERLAEMNGKSVEEHLGRSIDEALPPELAAKLKEIWRPVLERGESVVSVELQGTVWRSPEVRYWLASYQPLVSETGAVNGLMGFLLDITERKAAEQVVAGARQQLEHKVQARTAKLLLVNEHLLQEIEIRKKVEIELLAQQQKLQEMALDLAMAEERERDRIASELHDQVGQRLILAKIKLDALANNVPFGECEAEAGAIGTLIDQTLQDIRSLTFQIRPPLLASAGLEAALRWLGEELRADFGLEVGFSDDGKEKALRYEIRSTVFQAVRELMLNVAKHAGTRQCRVGFTRAGGCLVIRVEDDGVGLMTGGAEGATARSGGFGLLNVRQKIEHLGGSFFIETKSAGGTRATIKVPLEAG